MHAPEVRKNGSSNRELDEGRSVKLLMFGLHEHMPSFVILRMIVIARILARFDFSRGLSFNFCSAAGRAFLIDARCLSELFRLCFVAFVLRDLLSVGIHIGFPFRNAILLRVCLVVA